MSRQRFIYPEIFSSEDFLSLSHGARLLFVGMFTIADDYGRGKGSTATLQASIFGGDRLPPSRVKGWADEIRDRGMARWYTVSGSTYYDLPTWERWQKPKYKADSKIPPFPTISESGPNPGQSGPDSGPNPATGSNWVGKGRGSGLGSSPVGQTRRSASRPAQPLPVWADVAKNHAFEAFRAVHGVSPSWTPREFKSLYDGIRRCSDLAEFDAAWGRFLTETHASIAQHDPKTFESRIDRWRGKPLATASGKPAPGSCRNCNSDLAPGLEFCNGDCRRIYEKARTA